MLFCHVLCKRIFQKPESWMGQITQEFLNLVRDWEVLRAALKLEPGKVGITSEKQCCCSSYLKKLTS